ncbi:MAG: hypothetical protein WCK37_03890 [Candidatus Falkowbacteria bacterium]
MKNIVIYLLILVGGFYSCQNNNSETAQSKELKQTWTNIYQNQFDKKVDFTNLTVPSFYNPDKHFAIIVAKGTTMNEVVTAIKKKFNVHLYNENLDSSATTNDRIADKGYVIIFNKNIEADDNLKNLSTNKLIEMNISGITLLERLLLEVFYFDNTKKHLDIKNWTLCSGSRDSGGYVPFVHWNSDDSELYGDWCSVDFYGGDLRGRAVVTK